LHAKRIDEIEYEKGKKRKEMSYFPTEKKKITRIIRMEYNLYTKREYKTIKEC